MTHDVFISYAPIDKPIADGVCANLEADGVRCWIAPRDMRPGEDAPREIHQAITGCRVLVLIFSNQANISAQVYREIFLAADKKIIIVPFIIEIPEMTPRMRYILAGAHGLDAMNPPTQAQIDSLVQRVKRLLMGPPPSSAAVRHIPAWVWGGIIAVMLLVGSAAAGYWTGQIPNAIPITSSIIPTIQKIQTLTPTPVSGSRADRARSFAEPILTAIANRKPDFEEDFGTGNPAWSFDGAQGTFAIADGVARLRSSNEIGTSMSADRALTGKDMVLQFDARLMSGNSTSLLQLIVHFLMSNHMFFININPDLRAWGIARMWGSQASYLDLTREKGDTVSPIGETMRVTIIVQGSRLAMFGNQVPMDFIEDAYLDNPGRNFFSCYSFSPAVCEFDNVKFWNLSKISGLP
jgi:hypothetical protein